MPRRAYGGLSIARVGRSAARSWMRREFSVAWLAEPPCGSDSRFILARTRARDTARPRSWAERGAVRPAGKPLMSASWDGVVCPAMVMSRRSECVALADAAACSHARMSR